VKISHTFTVDSSQRGLELLGLFQFRLHVSLFVVIVQSC
jgi:hypothetical protein